MSMTTHRRRPASLPRGFTLVELMVTLTLLSILLGLAMPSFAVWIRNGKVRTVADSLQNGLRSAQAESLRRSRQVVFSLTNLNDLANAANVQSAGNGRNWSINTVPSMMAGGEASAFVESGVLGDTSSGVTVNGPAAICFNSLGRLIANPSTTLTNVTGGATCTATAGPVYVVSLTGADRPMRVVVSLGGQVRMCDPNKTLSATNPDGC